MNRAPRPAMPLPSGGRGPALSYRLVKALAAGAPDKLLRRVATWCAYIHYWAAREKRRSYVANVSGRSDMHDARPWPAFRNHALNIAELLAALSADARTTMSRVELHGSEHLDEALGERNGLILVTLHSGNWELAGLRLAAAGYPITTVAGTQLRRGWSNEVKAFKERHGIRVVSPRQTMRALYRDLTSNRIVVLHLDGDVFRGGIEVTLLNRTVLVPRGPAHLSRALGSPSAFAYCRRTRNDRLELRIEPPKPSPRDAEAEKKLIAEYVARLEKCVLEDPGQWCIFRKL